MSRFASLSRRLAIEDADTDIGEVEMVPAPEAEAPAAMAEVTEAGQEVEEITDAIGEASDDIDELETVGEIVADSIEPEVDGGAEGPGMEPVAAALAAEAVKRLRKKWGLSTPSSIGAPALESFGRVSSRKQATRLALLGITDTIKKVWEKIKAFFKGLWEKIRNAVVSIFQSNLKTQKRAQTLLKELRTNSTNFTKEEKGQVKSSSICTTFNENGKTDFRIADEIIKRHIFFTDTTGSLNTEIKKLTDKLQSSINGIDKSGTNDAKGQFIVNAYKSMEADVKTFGTSIKTTLSGGADNEKSLASELDKLFPNEYKDEPLNVVIGPFVRGKHLYFATRSKKEKITYQGESSETDVSIRIIKIGTVDSPSSPSSECPTLKYDQMVKICESVISGCEKVAASERAQKLGDDVSKEVFKFIDDGIKLAQYANDSSDTADSKAQVQTRAYLNYAKSVINSIINGLSNANGSMRVGTMSALNTGLDYVAQSMKNYKK